MRVRALGCSLPQHWEMVRLAPTSVASTRRRCWRPNHLPNEGVLVSGAPSHHGKKFDAVSNSGFITQRSVEERVPQGHVSKT
jgi:hypothetical protein